MKKVLLVFSFKSNPQPLQIFMPDSDAQAIFKAFNSTACPPKWAGYVPEEDFYWAVNAGEVAAVYIHNLEVLKKKQEEARQQQMQGQPGTPPHTPNNFQRPWNQGTSSN